MEETYSQEMREDDLKTDVAEEEMATEDMSAMEETHSQERREDDVKIDAAEEEIAREDMLAMEETHSQERCEDDIKVDVAEEEIAREDTPATEETYSQERHEDDVKVDVAKEEIATEDTPALEETHSQERHEDDVKIDVVEEEIASAVIGAPENRRGAVEITEAAAQEIEIGGVSQTLNMQMESLSWQENIWLMIKGYLVGRWAIMGKVLRLFCLALVPDFSASFILGHMHKPWYGLLLLIGLWFLRIHFDVLGGVLSGIEGRLRRVRLIGNWIDHVMDIAFLAAGFFICREIVEFDKHLAWFLGLLSLSLWLMAVPMRLQSNYGFVDLLIGILTEMAGEAYKENQKDECALMMFACCLLVVLRNSHRRIRRLLLPSLSRTTEGRSHDGQGRP